jgi:hypothetical protein
VATLSVVPGTLKTVLQDDTQTPYHYAEVHGLDQPDLGADRLLVAGDLTSSALQSQAAQVKQMLDGWGTIEQDYFVTRGNHDRSMAGTSYATCTAVPDTSLAGHDRRPQSPSPGTCPACGRFEWVPGDTVAGAALGGGALGRARQRYRAPGSGWVTVIEAVARPRAGCSAVILTRPIRPGRDRTNAPPTPP